MRDHMHEVEIEVVGVTVHRHRLVFIGVPGEVTVRHRSRPIEFHMDAVEPPVEPPGGWDEHEPEEWDWEEDTIPRD